jgi:nicotinamide-nucleotide amidase
VIVVGDELLEGRVADLNLSAVAHALGNRGLAVSGARIVADRRGDIAAAVDALLAPGSLVVTTGGLGPTDDDMTLQAVAGALGTGIVRNAEAARMVESWYAGRGLPCPPGSLVQADLPEGARPVPNPAGVAPGVVIEARGGIVICLPGVPREVEALIGPCLDSIGAEVHAGLPYSLLRTWGIPEQRLYDTIVEESLADVRWLAFLPRPMSVDIKIGGSDRAQVAARLAARLGSSVYSIDSWKPIEACTGEALLGRGLTISCAESCTGGLLGARITSVPGSSGWFSGGVVAYSDELKKNLLGVPAGLLESRGAVSSETACAMAEGVRRLTSSCMSVAVTGIAGPGGGTDEKPVGTVWIAVAGPGPVEARHWRFGNARAAVREAAVTCALGAVLGAVG